MIGRLEGKIIWTGDKFILLDVHGVGYKIYTGESEKPNLGADAIFFIHTHVREDSFDLYGFEKMPDLELFEMLISVSGVGPKGALSMLSSFGGDQLRSAIGRGDLPYLNKISGVGKKTAEKIIIELKDKISTNGVFQGEGDLDALEALCALGYKQSEAKEALKKITSGNVNEKIKEALKILNQK